MNENNLNKENYMLFIRNRITELRIKKNVSEYQMSYDLGKSKGYIQSISSGATLPSLDAFLDICFYFDITPVEFFDCENYDPANLRDIFDTIKHMDAMDIELLRTVLGRYKNLKLKE